MDVYQIPFCVILFDLQMTGRNNFFIEAGFEPRIFCIQSTHRFHKTLTVSVGMDQLEAGKTNWIRGGKGDTL